MKIPPQKNAPIRPRSDKNRPFRRSIIVLTSPRRTVRVQVLECICDSAVTSWASYDIFSPFNVFDQNHTIKTAQRSPCSKCAMTLSVIERLMPLCGQTWSNANSNPAYINVIQQTLKSHRGFDIFVLRGNMV